jgi:uncharacterized membrane protein
MFATVGRTWNIIKICWGILQKDRELLLFPLYSGAAMMILIAITFTSSLSTDTFEKLTAESGATLQSADVAFLAIIYFAASFIVIYFNSALIGAAMIRIRGGDPTVKDGFAIANSRLPQIIGWALISATVGLLLRILADKARNNIVGQIAVGILGGAWAYMTFMVIPILVVDRVGPIEAIKRSGSLFKRTWGEQVTANFGFGIISFLAILIGAAPAVLVAMVAPVAGIILGIITVGITVITVAALEGIFKAALYEYVAEDVVAEDFSADLLGHAYGPSVR